MNLLSTLDLGVILLYLVLVTWYGLYIYNRKKSAQLDSRGFFLAEGSLTWWAIGASLIASNISAEHFIGMSGSGFALGLAISTYEWMSAATLIIVAVFFIPVYLKNKIYTMPQFLSQRYSETVSLLMAAFWLLVYVFVNLTSIIYLGAIAISAVSGIPFGWCIVGLAIMAIFVTLGGMKVIGYTDVIQVAVLIIGGLATTYLALTMVSEKFGQGSSVWAGLSLLRQQAPTHFHMVFDSSHPYYRDLPGLAVIVGGMWVNNLNYWGCNQYIVQRALGADLNTARSGILFAAFLKLLIPVIAVLPGIAAFVLFKEGMFQAELTDAAGNIKPDKAYPTLLNLLPSGLKGLAFAALSAAIVASLAGKINSISTIFSLDIYRKRIKPDATEHEVVRMGRWVVVISMVIACLVAPALRTLDQAYQFIQEYVGFIAPGVLAIFVLGLFWKKTNTISGVIGAVMTIPLSALLKFLPAWTDGAFPDYPFLDRMSIVFLTLMSVMIALSLWRPQREAEGNVMEIDTDWFRCNNVFIAGSVLIVGILVALYTVFW
ncbi:MAG: sodium/sugar symporter [Bacteroidota bacterium]